MKEKGSAGQGFYSKAMFDFSSNTNHNKYLYSKNYHHPPPLKMEGHQKLIQTAVAAQTRHFILESMKTKYTI